MSRPVLVTGFGPFPGVPDNPSARLAQAVDGAWAGSVPVVGEVLPVSYRRGPARAVERARSLGARAVVGLGVAVSRSEVCVEQWAVLGEEGRPDVDGVCHPGLVGPTRVEATADCRALAAALDARLSGDAGSYVCNAWLYRVVRALPEVPVAFVHVPREGLGPKRLLAAIAAVWATDPPAGSATG